MNKIKIDIARKPIDIMPCDIRETIFAPSWTLLMSYKDGVIDWNEYKTAYKLEMQEAYRFDPDIFHEYAEELEKYDFKCWCDFKKEKDEKCHKYLLIDILKKVNKRKKV